MRAGLRDQLVPSHHVQRSGPPPHEVNLPFTSQHEFTFNLPSFQPTSGSRWIKESWHMPFLSGCRQIHANHFSASCCRQLLRHHCLPDSRPLLRAAAVDGLTAVPLSIHKCTVTGRQKQEGSSLIARRQQTAGRESAAYHSREQGASHTALPAAAE
jgi:hypothetical protein